MPGRHLARAETNDYSHSACKSGTLLRAEMKMELPLGEVTLVELLHDAGYATRHVGKWHLGESGFLPEEQGFQVNIARNHCGAPTSFLCPYGRDKPEAAKRYHGSPVPVLAEGRQKAEDPCACLTSESMKLITGRKSGGPPSLHLPFYDAHRPIMAKPGLDKKYHAKSCCMGFLARPTLCSRARRLMAGPSARRMVTARRTRLSE